MLKKVIVATIVGAVVGSAGVMVYLKTVQKAPPPAAEPSVPMQESPFGSGLQGGMDVVPPSPDAPIVVPDAVKGKWRAVKLLVEDRKSGDLKEYTVELGKELTLPESQIVVKAQEFLPDLRVAQDGFTSVSADPNNPAVHVSIREQGKELFKGWLFQLYPTMHPFQHERFGVTLKEGIPSS
jgi:hypothetical protein